MTERTGSEMTAFGRPFAAVFPELDDAEVVWEEVASDLEGEAVPLGQMSMRVQEGYFQGRIPCAHSECHAGGYEVERVIDEMVRAGEDFREGILTCPGWLVSSEPDSVRIPCVHAISYRVVLVYKSRS
ncbi:MAG: hypothetical protein ACE5HK_02245 [Candidatus Methylomirabilales bacterium]